ncbi:type VI secretion system baseplate subunit TssG [Janthinobacterium aquaticum]|nr:type VI secretion system baseplate subunit TssG [Janthinobacterium sp. FT58W]
MSQLREAPHGFNLFQALSIIERSAPQCAPLGTSVGRDEAVRLVAQVELAFAGSDIAAVQDSTRPGPPLTLTSSVLSLAGANGPLPMPYTEMLLERRRLRDPAALEFLDIFNQRLLSFLYRSRRKHHLALSAGALDQAPLIRCLDALASLGRDEGVRGPHGEQVWLRHAAVQGAAPRSMASLLAVVRDRLGIRFTGKQFVGGWHVLALSDRARLHGRSPSGGLRRMAGLGMGASLGARAWDQGAGMALDAPPLAPGQFAALLKGGKDHALLCWLVARHLQSDIAVQLKLQLAQRPLTRLASPAAVSDGAGQGASIVAGAAVLPPRLGLSSWLCSPGAQASRASYQQPRFMLSADAPERT